MPAPSLDTLVNDLAAEQRDLDALVASMPAERWRLPSAAEGWSVHDTIAHLAHIEEVSLQAIEDGAGFLASLDGTDMTGAGSTNAYLARGIKCGRALPWSGVLGWWRRARATLAGVLREMDPARRIPWFAGPMGARSFATARLMETWAHGQDCFDGLGENPCDTDRLRHIALIGCLTLPYAYQLRGRPPPEASVRVELELPTGAAWVHGPLDAEQRVRGTAGDFCRVVTRRRHVDDVDLEIRGPDAQEWMTIAQAYAGSPGTGRKPGQFPRARKFR